MLSLKQKLKSTNGASMVMAMVFLLFCLLIGGSVLASATANGNRIENMMQDQQEYYSQRSAMMLMADLLTDEHGDELQVVVTNVQTGDDITCTITSPSLPESGDPNDIPFLQQMLFETIISDYLKIQGITVQYSDFSWISGTTHNFALTEGTLQIKGIMDASGNTRENLSAQYAIETPNNHKGSQDYTFRIHFGEGTSHMVLEMDGSVNSAPPTSVTIGGKTTTTTTTIIRWSLPVVQKGQINLANQMEGT